MRIFVLSLFVSSFFTLHTIHLRASQDSVSPIVSAASRGSLSEVKRILDQNPRAINDVDFRFYATSLHWAARYGNQKVVRFLLEKGMNADIVNTNKTSPLHWAIKGGHEGVVKVLIEHGADINLQNVSGTSPLHQAVRSQNKKIVGFLLSRGVNTDLQELAGDSPLHVAVKMGSRNEELSKELTEMLLANGAHIDIKAEGTPPLYFAIKLGNKKTAELLLSRGANPNIKDINHRRALDFARTKELKDLVRSYSGISGRPR